MNNLDFLTSSAGRALLDRLADEDLSDSNTLSLVTALRREYTPKQVSMALTQARLRRKAVDKFGDCAARMLFTEEALQQASDPLVRTYRAGMIDGDCVIDAGCGIGADSLALAQAGKHVIGLDIDPERIAFARHNTAELHNIRFEVADVREGLPTDCDTVFFDPARRDERGRRIHDVNAYIPPLSLIDTWRKPRVAVKLSPGVDLNQLMPYGGAVEFISVNGDLKEAVLWRGFELDDMTATLLTETGTYHYRRKTPPEVAITEPRGWLVEPDPALIRAGLVQDIAGDHNGTLLDATIAYFTTDHEIDSVWVRCWQIHDWMPFHLKRLRAYLRERNVGHVTVKKRGSPLMPEALIGKLKLKGDESRILVLTRCMDQPIVLVC